MATGGRPAPFIVYPTAQSKDRAKCVLTARFQGAYATKKKTAAAGVDVD